MIKNLAELNREFMAERVEEPAKPALQSPAAQKPLWKELTALLLKITAIAGGIVFIFTFLFGLMRYQEAAMHPSVIDGDVVVYYRHQKKELAPQDMVALKIDGKEQVRRIIATGGDTVDITEDGLFINGALQYEAHIHHETKRYEAGVDFPLSVPQGEIFVLGDYRDNAHDSRVYGTVRLEDSLGKVMTIVRRRNM